MYSQYKQLRIAIKSGQLERIKEFLNEDSGHINIKIDDDGSTILHLAIRYKQADMVAFVLLVDGIDVEVRSNNGKTPLDYASSGYDSILCELEKMYELQLSMIDLSGAPLNGREYDYQLVSEYIVTCESQLVATHKIKCLINAAIKIINNISSLNDSQGNFDNVEDDGMDGSVAGPCAIVDVSINEDNYFDQQTSSECRDGEDQFRQRLYDLMPFMAGYPGFTSIVNAIQNNHHDITSIKQIAAKFNSKRSQVEAWKSRSRADRQSNPKAKLVLAFTELFMHYSSDSFKDHAFLDKLEDIIIQLEFIQANSASLKN